jgi:hypothetical protein
MAAMECAHRRNQDSVAAGISRCQGFGDASHNFHREMIAQRGSGYQRM